MKFGRLMIGLLAAGAFTFAVGDDYGSMGYGDVGYPDAVGYPGTTGYPGLVGYPGAVPDSVVANSSAPDNGEEQVASTDQGKTSHFILDIDFSSVSFSDMRENYSTSVGGFGIKAGLQKDIAKISSIFSVVGEGLLGFTLDYGDVENYYYGYIDETVYMYDAGLRFAALGRFSYSMFFADVGYQLGYDFVGFMSGSPYRLSYNCYENGCSEHTSGLVMSIPVDVGVKLGSKIIGARFAYDIMHPYSEYDASTYAFSVYVGL